MGKFLNKKYFLTGVIVLAAAAVAFNVFAQQRIWQDVSGTGGDNQSCWAWQGLKSGDKTRVLYPSGFSIEGKCVYTYTDVLGRTAYSDSDNGAVAAGVKPTASVPGDTLNYVNTSPGAKTQVYKETIQPVIQKTYPYTRSGSCSPGRVDIDSDRTPPKIYCIAGSVTSVACDASDSVISATTKSCTYYTGNKPATGPCEQKTVNYTASITCGQPIPKPAAPTNLTATYNNQGNNVDLSWNAVSGADGYKVFRAASVYQEAARLTGAGVTSYTDESFNCQSKGTFTYKIVAYNAGGDSVASNEAQVLIQGALSPVCASEVFPTCSVSNAAPSRGIPVTFAASNFQTSLNKYKWVGVQTGDIGCSENSTSCTTVPSVNDLSYGAYKIEVCDADTTNCSGGNIKQTVSCPAVDVRIPKLKAEVISGR